MTPELLDSIRQCKSKKEVHLLLNLPANGTGIRKVTALLKEYDITINGNNIKRRYPKVIKPCPVCGKEFECLIGSPKEKKTCSYACANTLFRSGENNGMRKSGDGENYRTICFRKWEKKCCCCDESTIVEVHHYDGNHDNHDVNNLVPLCPTHHQYWHSRYRHVIKDKVEEYLRNR